MSRAMGFTEQLAQWVAAAPRQWDAAAIDAAFAFYLDQGHG